MLIACVVCCSVSGVVPKEAVVAKTTGLVFEKGLIERALKVEEKCPVTGGPLKLDDLIAIQGKCQLCSHYSDAPSNVDRFQQTNSPLLYLRESTMFLVYYRLFR